jgi:DNA replication ATP-dependent helicase Dna2
MVRSRTEAETVAELVQALIRARIPPREIGVVVPYRAQGRLIRNLLRDVLPTREMLHDLVVDTVERMQGQEREVVLVSLATSSPGFAEQLAEFFFQPERLNVAITRPRTKLILIGSRRVLEAEPDLLETKAWVDLFRDLVAQCTTFTVPFRFSSANPDGGASG